LEFVKLFITIMNTAQNFSYQTVGVVIFRHFFRNRLQGGEGPN